MRAHANSTVNLAFDLINAFEDFLEDREVRIPSSDDEMKDDGNYDGNNARIYGTDFFELRDVLVRILEDRMSNVLK